MMAVGTRFACLSGQHDLGEPQRALTMIFTAANASSLIASPKHGRRLAINERRRTSTIDAINRVWYLNASVRAARAAAAPFQPILATILFKYRDDVANRPVLDIGYGGSLFERCDVRDLSAFASYSFHCVLDSSGTLGTLGHAPRLRGLQEIARVTPPRGLFVFAAHNRRCVSAKRRPHLEWSRNPVRQLANVVRWMRRYRNRARLRALQYDGPEYALINDPTHEYALLHYHVSEDTQRRQLAGAGFGLLEMYDSKGRPLADGADDRSSPWIWYVARRADIRPFR